MSTLIEQYREIKPKYERLNGNVCSALKQLIDEEQIPIFAIESRIKDESSFSNKLSRKEYSSPFEQVEDLCGIRIICYYQEDIEKICSIVKNEFIVISEENKQENLNVDQFGYSSFHYVVKLKGDWLKHPNARGLDELKAEIQIRTMLMHTWSAISHKLLYKREADVAPQFRRKLNRLSALIELADEQFNAIKNEKHSYQKDNSQASKAFDSSVALSSDSLMALHKYYFKNRNFDENDIPNLVNEIRSCDLTFQQFDEILNRCLPFLSNMEAEEIESEHEELPLWGFSGVIRTILDLSCDHYYERREDMFPYIVREAREKYRKILAAS
ncbi:(p)ppGpp synthetase [Photobacterium carnosum]|uniref:(P)ppGpp synthetase n=1 Tax=Photobacterium carnosum TaxID=2023717 RepID=A0A2N4UTQ9_9GAMM|nr:(p)ppGpp synthetase [Photobacterium carnosum]MCD9548657.1 (p)ppGpp synthetase [Photobacterium carnosum]MCF2305013.1 (p)ppGpp synthetase [Photobacterium carnosum]PLC58399.1 (p)ppGpp synthetase [Photobacterium carnosum]